MVKWPKKSKLQKLNLNSNCIIVTVTCWLAATVPLNFPTTKVPNSTTTLQPPHTHTVTHYPWLPSPSLSLLHTPHSTVERLKKPENSHPPKPSNHVSHHLLQSHPHLCLLLILIPQPQPSSSSSSSESPQFRLANSSKFHFRTTQAYLSAHRTKIASVFHLLGA